MLLKHPQYFKKSYPLIIFLLIDILLIVLHFVNFYRPFNNRNTFYMEGNDSYAEHYQNIKWLGMIFFSILAAIKQKDKAYYSWTLVFLFLFLEDMFRVHQVVTSFISQHILGGISTRNWKILEITVAGMLGLLVMSSVWLNYKKGSLRFKQHCRYLLLLLVILLFFGIFMDQFHRLYFIASNWKRKFIFGIFEDGGEMLTASCLLAYVIAVYKSKADKT